MRCPFAVDDGAYVLGALAPTDRAAFERHLPGCSGCREAVAALAVLPGLLRRLDAATAAAIGAEQAEAAPPTLLPATLAAAVSHRRRERRRRWWYRVGATTAAGCLAAVVGFGVHLADNDRSSVSLHAMTPVSAQMPVSAEVGLVRVSAGTRVEMECRYTSGHAGEWIMRLVVYPRSGGAAEQIGTWTARSGEEVAVSASTHLAPDQIERVELHRADDTTLLSWAPQ